MELGRRTIDAQRLAFSHFDKRGNDHARATGKPTGDQFAVATLEFVSKSPVKQKNSVSDHPRFTGN